MHDLTYAVWFIASRIDFFLFNLLETFDKSESFYDKW